MDISLSHCLADLYTFAGEDCNDGVEEYFEVNAQGNVFYVEEVVLQSLNHFFDRGSVAEFDHAPRSDAGSHLVNEVVEGHLSSDLGGIELALGARSDDGHIAADYVPELWQFVETVLAEGAADFGDAIVVEGRKLGAIGLGINVH